MQIVEATVLIANAGEAEEGEGRLEPAHALSGTRLALEALGPDALVEPVRVSGGVARLRALLAGAPDPEGPLDRLRDVCGGGKGAPRLVHAAVTSLDALAHRVRHPLAHAEATALSAAFGLGYYSSPRACRLTDVATHLGESVTPVHRRIQAAERHVFAAVAGPGPAWEHARSRVPPARVAGPVEATLRIRWAALEPPGPASWVAGWTAAGRFRLAPVDGATRPPEAAEKGLAEVAAALGPGACVRPALLATDGAWLRAELFDGTRLEEVAHRVDEAGRAVGWQGAEVVSVLPAATAFPDEPAQDLTPRQAQVLRLAQALGYYRTPRACGLEELAGALGVSVNAVHKSLTAAENRTIAQYLASTW